MNVEGSKLGIDQLDLRIIELLKKNSRLKSSEIARKLEKPRTTVVQRIKKLEDAGVIQAYTVNVRPEALGYNYYAYIAVKVRKGLVGKLDQLELANKLVSESRNREGLPYVEEAVIVTGAYDIILRVWVRNWEELSRYLLKYLPSIEEIQSTETFMVLRKVVESSKS
ncbi:MAG: Lrp/AsnC family transcriptional regulator [Zestosphaera sp.]